METSTIINPNITHNCITCNYTRIPCLQIHNNNNKIIGIFCFKNNKEYQFNTDNWFIFNSNTDHGLHISSDINQIPDHLITQELKLLIKLR